jgi:hypothetical protein
LFLTTSLPGGRSSTPSLDGLVIDKSPLSSGSTLTHKLVAVTKAVHPRVVVPPSGSSRYGVEPRTAVQPRLLELDTHH